MFGPVFLFALAACRTPPEPTPDPNQEHWPHGSATQAHAPDSEPAKPPSKTKYVDLSHDHQTVLVAPPPWSGGSELVSALGQWRIVYRLRPMFPAQGERCALDLWIFDATHPLEPRGDVTLAIDALPPALGHAWARPPAVAAIEDDYRDMRNAPAKATRFHAEDLVFDQSGHWQIHIDITQAARSERAELDLELE